MNAARPDETAALVAALTSVGTTRVRLPALLTAWAAAAPRLVGTADQHAVLAATLDQLAADDTINLPAAGSWDRSTTPPLPKFVTVPAARKPPRAKPWRTFPWCQQLGWVASLPSLSDSQYDQLRAVHEWLRTNPTGPLVPHRHRSVQLFGNEKALEALVGTTLFAAGRLTLELLRCQRSPPRSPPSPSPPATAIRPTC